jgi:hypothetical protein
MDAIRERIKNPIVMGVIGFVLGLVIGWFAIGWGIWPVNWTDATPNELSYEWKVEFLRSAIQAYGQNGNTTEALARYTSLGADAQQAINTVAQDPKGLSNDLLSDFSNVVAAAAPGPATGPATGPASVTTPEATTSAPAAKKSALPILLVALCLLILVLVAFLAYMFFFRKRLAGGGQQASPEEIAEARRQAGYTDYTTKGAEPPIGQFMASYKMGDDLFDDSFSIDSASGEFLGECGVGISETIGVGDHKKVTAFEVWLFDKNDIQTVTKVLMSAHAFNDGTIRQRLEAKGEPVLVESGIETVLETQTLQLVARVADMGYGDSSMPEESYFDHVLLELSVWSK